MLYYDKSFLGNYLFNFKYFTNLTGRHFLLTLKWIYVDAMKHKRLQDTDIFSDIRESQNRYKSFM